MERLLKTRDIQQLLQVDRITIYRMLDAGELPGIKLGGQWRFPEQAVHDWLEGVKGKRLSEDTSRRPLVPPEEQYAETPSPLPRLTDLVSTVCLQNIQEGFAQAVGVASLVFDLAGTPLTSISNTCAFCHLGRTSEGFRRSCSASWSDLANVEEDTPAVHLCHAGIGYAVAPIWVHGTRVGLVVGGQFWSQQPDTEQMRFNSSRLGMAFGLEASDLLNAMASVPVFSDERVFLVTRLLATIADALSEIGFQAYEVRLKLQQIAQIAKTL
jgi:excisionase family DNA binding protein